MKKILFLFAILLSASSAFAQKIIDKPDYGLSNLPGSITKIELTPEATILHFYIKYYPGQWIFIPKESFIQDVNGGKKNLSLKRKVFPWGKDILCPRVVKLAINCIFLNWIIP